MTSSDPSPTLRPETRFFGWLLMVIGALLQALKTPRRVAQSFE